jgi:hypothetical protein
MPSIKIYKQDQLFKKNGVISRAPRSAWRFVLVAGFRRNSLWGHFSETWNIDFGAAGV